MINSGNQPTYFGPTHSASILMPPTLSPDGYVRITFSRLQLLNLLHVCSDLDQEVADVLTQQAIPVVTAGYTEWQTDTVPAISIGWDWYVDGLTSKLLALPGSIRSNVMLRDKHGYDLGATLTSNMLQAWISAFDWQVALTNIVIPAPPCQN